MEIKILARFVLQMEWRGRGRFSGIRGEQKRRGVAQSMVQGAMEEQVFGALQFVVNGVGVDASMRKFVKGSACKL